MLLDNRRLSKDEQRCRVVSP